MAAQLQHLDQRIKDCECHLEVLVKKSFAELFERLLTIPSIGAKTAIELIIVTDGFSRFEDVKALCAYIAVSPTTFRSSSSVNGKCGIAKLGQGRMRQLLFIASAAIQKACLINAPDCRSALAMTARASIRVIL